jgi:phosphohistidine phosphatase SixA
MSDALRPEATFASFRALLGQQRDAEAVMVVGHNPSLNQFASRLVSGGNNENSIDLKKAAAAKLEMKLRGAQLQWCITPKVLRAAYESSISSSRPKSSRK